MADIKLFNITGKVKELQSGTVTLEKELQNIIEKNMKTFFGVTFVKSEFKTTDGGEWTVLVLMRTIVQLFLNIKDH